MSAVQVNHVGLVVSDLDRSRRFWTEVFGFRELTSFEVPDDSVAQLMKLRPPIGLRAVYLEADGFIVELLHYADLALERRPPRVWNERGLTHVSIGVSSFEPYLTKIRTVGGSVLEETRAEGMGMSAIVVKDPDGQMIELIVGWTKPTPA